VIGPPPKHLLPEPESSHARGELNRSVQNGTLDLRVELGQIQQIDVFPRLITKTVEVHTPEGVLKLRCFGAMRFAQSIREAIAAL